MLQNCKEHKKLAYQPLILAFIQFYDHTSFSCLNRPSSDKKAITIVDFRTLRMYSNETEKKCEYHIMFIAAQFTLFFNQILMKVLLMKFVCTFKLQNWQLICVLTFFTDFGLTSKGQRQKKALTHDCLKSVESFSI